MSEFKDMLKSLRIGKHLSQSELANKLGISKSAISMYEVGKRQPDFETLEMIADFFNTDMNFLLGKSTSENENNYYINPETAKMAQEISDNEELSLLFDAARDAAPEDLKTVHSMLMALKRKEKGE